MSENRFGRPSGPITEGKLGGHTVYMLSRHGQGHAHPPAQINYRANIWALKVQCICTIPLIRHFLFL